MAWQAPAIQYALHANVRVTVEGFLRDITNARLRRSVFRRVSELITEIDEYVAHHNVNAKPFILNKNPGDILRTVIRANSRSSSKQQRNAALRPTDLDGAFFSSRSKTQSRRLRPNLTDLPLLAPESVRC